ncbi:MAG: hypothetical protein WB919_18950 [Candidatus Sulfotelmatobacter sp.]
MTTCALTPISGENGPIEFIGSYMQGWFDYAICGEIHQLAGETAQGNALGTLSSCTDRIVGLTATLLGGYPPLPGLVLSEILG